MEYEKASPKLQEKCLKGEVIPKLELELTATYGGSRATYLKYELTTVFITSCEFSATGDEARPTIVIGNNFEEIKVTYTEYELEEKDKIEFEFKLEGSHHDDGPGTIPQSSEYNEYELPEWFQTNLQWWHNGLISENEVFQSIEYLKQNGVLQV